MYRPTTWKFARLAAIGALLLSGACARTSHVRTFASTDCPRGWRFLYMDYQQEGPSGYLGRAVCSPSGSAGRVETVVAGEVDLSPPITR